jgi:hypothetical protein
LNFQSIASLICRNFQWILPFQDAHQEEVFYGCLALTAFNGSQSWLENVDNARVSNAEDLARNNSSVFILPSS